MTEDGDPAKTIWTRAYRGFTSDADLYAPAKWLERYIDFRDGGLTHYQRDLLAELPRSRRLAIRSPHGTGKTATAALTVIWFSLTREMAGIDWKVIVTASAWRHLTIYLFPEIHKWLKRVRWDELGMEPPNPRTQLLDLRLKLRHGAASAVASDEPVNLEGAHADSLLYVFDEAKAIPPETWDAAEGALSGGRTDGTFPEAFALAISTPGPPAGRFYDIHARKAGLEDWHPHHIKIDEAIRAKRISSDWVEQRRRQFGDASAVFRNRVLGEFAAADSDGVIPLAWVEAAIERWHEWDDEGAAYLPGRSILSVDVARSGADSTVLAYRQGNVVTGLKRVTKRDTMAVTGLVQGAIGAVATQHGKAPTAVIDTVGVGAGVYDRLKELKYDVFPYVGSGRTFIRDGSAQFGFANVRSAAYWTMRELLDPANGNDIMLPDDDELIGDLTVATWEITTGVPPRIKVETKEAVVKRLGRSPDAGDACFPAGTLIWAESGDIPIEQVGPGMKVWTRRALRTVLAAEMTRRDARVITAELADGRTLTATPNHPAWDGEKFRPLDTFAMTDSLWACEKSASSTEGSSSPDTPTASDASIASTTGLRSDTEVRASGHFTSRSTKRRWARSLMGGMSIIATAIRSTIALRTWRSSLPAIMRPITPSTGLVVRTKTTWHASEGWPRRGTPPLRVWRGTQRTGSARGTAGDLSLPGLVSAAVLRSSPSFPIARVAAGALATATTPGTTTTASWGPSESVPSAARPSSPSARTSPSIAPIAVQLVYESGTADVWNLEVEGEHEYFANGVLVHNCVMSFWAERASRGGGMASSGAATFARADLTNPRPAITASGRSPFPERSLR